MTHTILKHRAKEFIAAMASDTENLMTNVAVEAKGQLTNNDRPGDVAGRVKGQAFAIDVFTARVGSATNKGKSVDKVIEDADAIKRQHYDKRCKDSGVLPPASSRTD